MSKQFYFISGLPRSGSTLLSALLSQNPKFYAGPMSPILKLTIFLNNTLNSLTEYKAYPKPKEMSNYIKDIFKYYYADIKQEVIFDKHRYWTNYIEDIKQTFSIEPKIICTVRNIDEICTSLTNLMPTSYTDIMEDNDRVLRFPYESLKKAFINNRNCIHIVEYNSLVNQPEQTMYSIYKFLGKEYYQHNFNNIEHKYKEDDSVDEHPLLHTIRPNISKSNTIAKQDFTNRFKGMEFWRE